MFMEKYSKKENKIEKEVITSSPSDAELAKLLSDRRVFTSKSPQERIEAICSLAMPYYIVNPNERFRTDSFENFVSDYSGQSHFDGTFKDASTYQFIQHGFYPEPEGQDDNATK